MPYKIENPPDRIKMLPKAAQMIWIAAYNSAHKQYKGDEAKANATAWSAVKKKYKKNKEGKWVAMGEPRLIFDVSLEFKEMPDGKYKSTIPVARVGKWKHPEYGEFEITSNDLSEISSNFGMTRESLPPVNYEHGEGVDASIGAAGWMQKIWRDDDRLLAEVYWTKDGWGKVKEGAFKYISPEIRFNYKDKENGKDQGTVLVGAALTTMPWIEDLVIDLSERKFMEEKATLADLANELELPDVDPESIRDALEKFLQRYDIDLPKIREKTMILRILVGELTSGTGIYDFSEQQLQRAIVEIKELKEWTRKYINDLPDSAFAYIEQGGEKDDDGKTVPRSLRHFPYRNKNGTVDIAHLRNALARAPQSPHGDKALPALEKAAKAAGIGKDTKGREIEVDIKVLIEKLSLKEDANEGDVLSAIDELSKPEIDLTEVRKKLSLKEDADMGAIVNAIAQLMQGKEDKQGKEGDNTELSEQIASLTETVKGLTTKLSESESKREAIEQQLSEKDFEMDFGARLQKGTVLPKMKEWAKAMYLSDAKQYSSVMESMPVLVNLGEIGSSGQIETDAVKRFNDEMKKLQDERKLSYRDAVMVLNRENPEIWQEYRATTD